VGEQAGSKGLHPTKRLQSPLTRYALAVVSIALVSLLFFLVDRNDTNTDLRCFAFASAILLSALLGGLGPGLLATGLAAIANQYVFFAPSFSFRIASEEKVARIVLFTGEGILLAFIGTFFRQGKSIDTKGSWKRYLPALLFVSTATADKGPCDGIGFGADSEQQPQTCYRANRKVHYILTPGQNTAYGRQSQFSRTATPLE
jgi:hypothetical protein